MDSSSYFYRGMKYKQDVFVTYYAPDGKKYWKSYFKHTGPSQGHKAIDLEFIWKGIINGVCMPNMKPLDYILQFKS